MNPKNDNRVAHYRATAFFLQKQLRLERSGTLPIGVMAHSKLEKDSNNEVRCSRSGACPAVIAGIGPVELDKLNSLKGAEFSSRYDSDQQSGHKDAVSLFERYAKGGDNPKLKD
jgi:hypothetical protein